jgi:AcrR family transcriptional regulator
LPDKLADKLGRSADKLERKLDQVARHQERLSAKTAGQVEALQRAADTLEALHVWMQPDRGTRKPRFTRDDIAAAAIRIADNEGFDAVSMRRIASELDAGTMTLYHYVRTKDELMMLLTDAVMGEVVVPRGAEFPVEDWRAALLVIALRTRAAMVNHPWILDISDDPPIGPNAVRHFDQSLQAVASLELPLAEKFDIVLSIDDYVFGYCLRERNDLQPGGGPHDDEMIAYIESLLVTGDYPQLQALADERGLANAWGIVTEHLRDPARFRRNLDRFLDGIEASLTTRSDESR